MLDKNFIMPAKADPMKILLVTPAVAGSRKGNRVTALRWARVLRTLGHRVVISQSYRSQSCDVLIALHARRSFPSISRYHQQRPAAPLIVVLTGTDLYHDIHRSKQAQQSLLFATHLVTLQDHGIHELPRHVHSKVRVIYQSASPPGGRITKIKRSFQVCVSGHLRPVKDPFRTALAVRDLPSSSRIRVVHLGAALSQEMAQRARKEEKRNQRYRWLGELPAWRARQTIARSRLFVVSSTMEGCPNVASEALASEIPMLSTKISGMIGLLGPDYSGYFPVGDSTELTKLLLKAEQSPDFYRSLQKECRQVKPKVLPRNERKRWKSLLQEIAAY